MTDIQAAMGRVQLGRLPAIVERRRWLAERYRALLQGIDWLVAPEEPRYARTNWQSFCVRLAPEVDQEDLIRGLAKLGISVQRGIMNVHQEAGYAKTAASGSLALKNSEWARDHSVLLPLFCQMTGEQVQRVVDALTKVGPA